MKKLAWLASPYENDVSAQYFMVTMGVQRLYALHICAIHKGIALLTIIY